MSVGNTGFGEEALRRSQIGILFYEKHWAIYEGWFWESYRHDGAAHGPRARGRSAGDDVPPGAAVSAPETTGERGAPAAAAAVPRWLTRCAGGAARSSSTWCSRGRTSGRPGGRLRHHSPYNHYVYLADGWLHGRLALPGQPPNENDWAKVEVLKLHDGRELRGIYGSRTGGANRPLLSRCAASRRRSRRRHRVAVVDSLRVVPAVPGRADGAVRRHLGAGASTTFCSTRCGPVSTRCCCSCCCAICARAACRGGPPVDDLWLTALFGVGSVYYFCSVVGQVWFTAQIVAVTLSIALRVGVDRARGVRCWRVCSSRSASRRARPGWWSRCSSSEVVRAIGGLGRASDAARRGARSRGRRCRFVAADRRGRGDSGGAQRRALRRPVRVRAQVLGRAVAGADVPLRSVQLPLPVTQPRGRADSSAARDRRTRPT